MSKFEGGRWNGGRFHSGRFAGAAEAAGIPPEISAIDMSGAPDEIALDYTEDGVVYWMLHSGAAYTDGATLKAAVLATGGEDRGSFDAIAPSTTEPFDFSAIADGDYRLDFVLESGATGLLSNVVGADITLTSPTNLLVNGDFASATGWNTTGTWAISGGQASVGPGLTWNAIDQYVTITGGVAMEAYFDIVSVAAAGGDVRFRIQEESGASPSSYEYNFSGTIAVGPSPTISFTPAADCTQLKWAIFLINDVSQFAIDNAYLGLA